MESEVSKFNSKSAPKVGPRSAVVTASESAIRNHAGGTGHVRDAKSELYLLTVSFMDGSKTHYESEEARYTRLIDLVSEVVKEEIDSTIDSAVDAFGSEWLLSFVKWVREDAGLRTVAVVLGVESARARVAAGAEGGNRELVSAACQRADEPAEVIAYWISKYGKPLPYWLRKGVGDAATRLFNEFSYLKYGGSKSVSVSMQDVIRLSYPRPKDSAQEALFGYITGKLALYDFHEKLPMISARKNLYDIPRDNRYLTPMSIDANNMFKAAGMTWENVSEWSAEGMTGAAWDAIIPSMGMTALIRNLRNFDQAGISRESQGIIISKLTDPDLIRKSKLMPYQIYQAYRSVESVRWSNALDGALQDSLSNVPVLSGKTRVMVDTSGSMNGTKVSEKSVVSFMQVAQLFGAAWKCANPDGVDLYQFGSQFNPGWGSWVFQQEGIPKEGWSGVTKRIEAERGSSPLRVMDRMHCMGGTLTHEAFAEVSRGESKAPDRIVLITDEQAFNSLRYDDLPVAPGTPVYIWNLVGYEAGVTRSGSYQRHTFGGLSDAAFRLIPLLESGRNTGWPWE